MLLNNLVLTDSNKPVAIQISGRMITALNKYTAFLPTDRLKLTFNNAMAFPGLINSHDHLDFNLFPQLGDQIYNNYTEWGANLHNNYKEEISKVLKIPLELREQWGIYKNLLCGVTTVANHGQPLKTLNPVINVHEQYYCLHSIQFEKKWKIKLNNPLKKKFPVVLHIGEGTDTAAAQEIDQLIQWNLFKKKIIGVHAVAMSKTQATHFNAIVWCPQSNYFLLNKTAPVDVLKKSAAILFGTDSTLTSHWNIWDHIHMARQTKLLTDVELYHTLNANPARVWLSGSEKIVAGNTADLVVTKLKDRQTGLDAFYATKPEDLLLVLCEGKIVLFDKSLLQQLVSVDLSDYHQIMVNGITKYIKGDLPALIRDIKKYNPEATFPVKLVDLETA